jgi:hypothetical protein
MVGVLWEFSSSTVASISWTTTCGFMVVGFTSLKGRHLSDSVVDSHEVGALRELGDDFSRTHPLSLTCYRGDRHEAQFGASVHSSFDLIKCLCEIPYGEGFTEASTPFVSLLLRSRREFSSSLASSAGALADNSSAEISSKYRSGRVP